MNKSLTLILLLTLLYFGKTTVKAQAPAQCQDVMLQAFYWDSYTDSKWTTLNSKVSEIAPNFSLVWLPVSGDDNNAGMGYTPVEYFNQNNKFGNSADLKTLISNFKLNGTRCIADIVINHRTGNLSWTDFPAETYKGITYTWGPETICSTDECVAAGFAATGAPDTGDDFGGARDIDHTNTNVRNTIKAYLDFLKNEMGYSGWRYDMTKGYSASYVNEYNTSADNYFSVGEYWDGYDLIKSWINSCNNNSTSFDFPAKYALNASMWSGGMDLTKLVWKLNGITDQPAGLIHNPDTKRYAVTFVDNHDTYRNNDKFTGNVLAAYAFLMGSPGVPCVFLPHWNANKTALSAMIAARRAVQLHSESAVTVNQSGTDIYVATVTGLSGTMIVKIGSGSYTAPSDYTLATSGTDYAIWTKISTMAPFLSVSPSGGTFYSPKTVTMSTSTGASVYYTTNNTPPTTASTLYTLPIPISSTTTLRAVAYNPTTQLYSDEVVNTYIFSTFPTTLSVRFKVPGDWAACKVYSWTSGGTLTAGWPGNAMTLESDGYYSYSISGFTTLPIGIVFNNGDGSSQTVDLFASADICWESGALSGSNYSATEVICLGTGIKKTNENTFGIYPNPSHGQLNIEAPQKGQLTLYTLQGKLLMQKNLENTTENLDLSKFGKGIYLLRFEGKEGRSFRKVVVE